MSQRTLSDDSDIESLANEEDFQSNIVEMDDEPPSPILIPDEPEQGCGNGISTWQTPHRLSFSPSNYIPIMPSQDSIPESPYQSSRIRSFVCPFLLPIVTTPSLSSQQADDEQMLCSVTGEPMIAPVLAGCDHVVDAYSVQLMIDRSETPRCRHCSAVQSSHHAIIHTPTVKRILSSHYTLQ